MTPRPPRRKARTFAVCVAAALLCTTVVMLVIQAWWQALLNLSLAAIVLSSLTMSDAAWRSGYLTARSAMYRSLSEATQRGLTFEQWLQAEIERDAVPPPPPPH